MIAAYLCLSSYPAQRIELNLTPGIVTKYRVLTTVTEFAGSGNTAGTSTSTQLPVEIHVATSRSLEIVTGPLFARGRSVGRSKRSTVAVGAGGTVRGQAPVQFFVVLPPNGITPGQTWKSGFSGPSPLFAGLQANYKFVQITSDRKFAKLDLKVEGNGAGHVKGTGTIFLRLRDGYIDHGTAKFDIAYMRPDLKDRNKMIVNNHVGIDCKITPL